MQICYFHWFGENKPADKYPIEKFREQQSAENGKLATARNSSGVQHFRRIGSTKVERNSHSDRARRMKQ